MLFLTLAFNKLSNAKGFKSLKHLKLLDLEGNIISEDAFVSSTNRDVDVGVNMNTADTNADTTELNPFPASLQYLILRGNPICQNPEYRLIVTGAAPFIEELDEKRVTNVERRVALRSTKYF